MMEPEPRHMERVTELSGALVDAGHDVHRIFDALQQTLAPAICDRCTVELTGSSSADPTRQVVVSPRHVILPLPSKKWLHGSVTITRDESRPELDAHDLAAITTCIAYTTLAGEAAVELEAERTLSRAARERAELFHRTVLGIVGHDLHAPAAAILMSTEIMVSQHQADPALNDMVTRIVSFAHRMTGMVDQLLDLSRVQLGGGIRLARSAVHLVSVIESVVAELSTRHPSNRFSIAGSVRRKGVWDPDRLRQVVATIATNAARHGQDAGRVELLLSQDDWSTTVSVHNQVRDEPVPAGALQQLFEPYNGAERERVGAGRGLALYIARKIVEAHGGGISAESCGTETVFRVVLPTDEN